VAVDPLPSPPLPFPPLHSPSFNHVCGPSLPPFFVQRDIHAPAAGSAAPGGDHSADITAYEKGKVCLARVLEVIAPVRFAHARAQARRHSRQ
jgi:hypothetical protein